MLESTELEFLLIALFVPGDQRDLKRENHQLKLPLLHQIFYGLLNVLDGNHHYPLPVNHRESNSQYESFQDLLQHRNDWGLAQSQILQVNPRKSVDGYAYRHYQLNKE